MSQVIERDRTLNQGRHVDTELEVPNGRNFISMLEAFRASGGVAPSPILDQLFREYRVAKPVTLAELVATGLLFGFLWRDNLWVPMFQFEAEDLVVKACAQKVRAQLPLLSGWTLASWFATPKVQLDGHTPVDMLDSNLEAVLLATKSHDSFAHA